MTSAQTQLEDPAAHVALSRAEIDWLGAFLASDDVPETAMPLEALDGFLAALVAGPETVPTAEYVPVIWDTNERFGPVVGDGVRLSEFNTLLARHRRAIRLRVEAGYPHVPLLEDMRPGQEGCAWSYGFLVGVAMRVAAWQPLFESERLAPLTGLLQALAEADELTGLEANSTEERSEILDALSWVPSMFHAYWRDRAAGLDLS